MIDLTLEQMTGGRRLCGCTSLCGPATSISFTRRDKRFSEEVKRGEEEKTRDKESKTRREREKVRERRRL